MRRVNIQVVEKIKAVANEVRLLVVDRAADVYFVDKGVAVTSALPCVEYINCPPTNPLNGLYSHYLRSTRILG